MNDTAPLVVVGVPGALASWGFRIVQRIARAASHEVEFKTVQRFDTLEDEPPPAARRIYFSHYPSAALAALARAHQVRPLVFLDDPLHSMRYLRVRSKCSFKEALRRQTASASLIHALRDGLSATLISPELVPTLGTLGKVASDFLGIELPAERLSGALRGNRAELGEDAPLPAALALLLPGYEEVSAAVIPEDEAEIAQKVLEALWGSLETGERPAVTWPRNLFFLGGTKNEPAPQVLDVTGTARTIFYGPYLHLPPGRWQVRAILGFNEGVAGLPFSLELHGPKLLGKARVLPERFGLFTATFAAVVTDPARALELKIRTERGAIEGRFALVQVDLQPE